MPLFNMKDWIISITAVVLITSIVCLILPPGKMGKYIKSIFSLLTILVVIKPIVYIKDINLDYQQIIGVDDIAFQDDFLMYVFDKKIKEHEQNCVEIVEKIGVKNANINIEYDVKENQNIIINFVKINLQNSVIISDEQHINIKEEMIADIASYLNINKNMVIIYE